ncbi:hypothetical protein BOTNAR_0157g00030 [Botryotinia narcissicola]|uniref:Uncharacterized protein n=1 Tax=Botryotinia narcissicola TaxID=278944 RepID=A0A4Z1IKF7_9HELO|nr:hypothetical protein BOTNAR_0157g00030 [Botryotinia narcissicola]
MNPSPSSTLLITVAILAGIATAGPVAYGVCQSGCAAVVMACYGAGGATLEKIYTDGDADVTQL